MIVILELQGCKERNKKRKPKNKKKKKKGTKKIQKGGGKQKRKPKSGKGPTSRAKADNEIFEGPYGYEHPEAIDVSKRADLQN